MSKPFMVAFGAVLLAMIVLVAFWRPSGRPQASGKIGKVRAQKVDDNETILILDFNLRNDSDRLKSVGNTTASLHAADGSVVEGHVIGASSLANVFSNFPALGDQYNPPLKGMEDVKAGQSVDRTIGIRFDAPDETIARRKDVVLDVEYINGPIVELTAK
jgi:hypothetical protein